MDSPEEQHSQDSVLHRSGSDCFALEVQLEVQQVDVLAALESQPSEDSYIAESPS